MSVPELDPQFAAYVSENASLSWLSQTTVACANLLLTVLSWQWAGTSLSRFTAT